MGLRADVVEGPPLPPPFSIVIEWENAGRIGVARARRMLARLHAELVERRALVAGTPELLVMFNERLTTRAEVRALIDEAGADWPATIVLMPAVDGDYYEQKNHGARQVRGDVLIFLDSDVVPEPGWLGGLLDAIAIPGVDVVCGTTSIEAAGFYSTAMALVWFFPVRTAGRGLEPVTRFFANNVAFRREVFERHAFPRSGQYRGQCGLLAEELLATGHGLWRARASHVLHPPPENLRHFVLRALWHGHDDAVHKLLRGGGSLRGGTGQLAHELRRARDNVGRHRAAYGLGAAGAIGALAVGLGYYGLKYGGFVATLLAPRAVTRLLPGVET